MPASALAIANRRRVTRTSASAFASLRSTTGERSLRIDSAVISLSSNQRGGNHEPDALGIARRQQESSVLTGGISGQAAHPHARNLGRSGRGFEVPGGGQDRPPLTHPELVQGTPVHPRPSPTFEETAQGHPATRAEGCNP